MAAKMNLKKYRLPVLIGLTVTIIGALMAHGYLSKPKSPPPFGYHALKINGAFVSPEVFLQEKNSFFMRWRRNATMLRKTEEEKTDLLLDEIINRVVMDDYLYRRSGVTVTPHEAVEYINRYIKTKFASPSDFNAFMHDADYKSEVDLQKAIKLYLLKLKCFSKIAKETGLTVPPAELDSLYALHIAENRHSHPKSEFSDMVLMERFGTSERFKQWIEGIKSTVSVEILDPGLKAYRLYRDGRLSDAGALYEKVFRKRHNEIHLRRAIECCRMAKDWKKVLRLSRIGIEKYPHNIDYRLNNAEALYRKGRTDDALKAMKDAESRIQGSIVLRESVMQMYTALGMTKEAERVKNTFSN